MFMFTQPDPVLESTAGQHVEKEKNRFVKLLFKYNAVVLLIVMFIVATILSPYFLTPENMFNVLRQQSTFMLVGLGMLLVMLTGGIDLSVSSTVTVSSIMVCYCLKPLLMQNQSWGLLVSVILAIVIGFAFGCINGFFISVLNMPAFIVTLAMMYAGRGVAFIITDANTILLDQSVPANEVFVAFATGADPVLHLPYPTYVMIALIIVIGLVLHFTAFGRLITAVGSNETAVQLAGVNSKKYKFWAYAICGALCGVAGVILAARTGSGTALSTSVSYDMTSIAAVVIGGASLKGGEGNVPMTIVGVFVLAIIGNIMNLVGVGVYPQLVVKAVIIILAVLLKSISSKRVD
ncbi:MAG: ABC transporter permease [Clostridiales Family XIII bacterium]|jgi:ribose transport system permease protein|nr:ABC transporter permease [Clostridiales Family XIII bacterium]